MSIQNDILRALRTIRPDDGKRCLPIRPDEAERLWHTEVLPQRTKDFELLVEPHGKEWCFVSVRLWSESDWTANGGGLTLIAAIIITSTILLWGTQ